MPTPLELVLDPVSITIFAFYGALMLWEVLFPAKQLPRIKGWVVRGMGAFAVYFLIAAYLPLIWDEYLANYQLMNLSGLGIVGGALIGTLIFEFFLYVWHWAMHKSNLLWKVFHQMHHSAERHDTIGAFYFSLMDMVGFTFLGSLSFSLVAGFDPASITIILLLTNFLSIFQHANIRTPVWLGYFIQRPESHSIHHARDIHGYNYSDLPIFDILFGTFKNPDAHYAETGFYDGASGRILDMLMFKDVSKPASAAKK